MQRARSMSSAATSEAASFRVPARYRFQKHLGSGSYGVVASFHDHDRGRDVAIKRVRKVFDNFLVLRRTLREIRLMAHFRHPNLMRLHKVLPLDATTGDLYMSLELMDCDLDSLVHTKRVVLTDQQVRCFTAQILLGLMAMHAGHVIHRDLKPANIFVRLNRGQVKIGDLGLSRGIGINDETGEASHPSEECLTEYVVTRWYRAPEVLLARAKYGPPVDVWSVGCIVYEMCSRKALFPGKNSYDQLKRILAVLGSPSDADTNWVPRESMPLLQKCLPSGGSSSRGSPFASLCNNVCSSDGVDLLQQMCLFNPLQRIGVEQALTHPYLAGITSEQDRRTARAVDPADVTYDKMFDGVSKQGEGAANVQLGRLLRREVAKFNPVNVRTDTTPERSQVTADRTPKTANNSRTPRGGPQTTAEALVAAVTRVEGGSARGTKDLTGRHLPQASDSVHHQPELSYRRTETEAEVYAARRRSEPVVSVQPSRGASANAVPNALSVRRRSADDARTGPFELTRQHLEASDSKHERLAPGEESITAHMPLSLPGPPAACYLNEDRKPSARASRAENTATSVPSLRRRVAGCSGGSATTVSTRATPPGSRPVTEATSRASSRMNSISSRARVPSVGPQWVAEPEGLLFGAALPGGPVDATTVSPRAGAPVLHEEAIRRDSSQRDVSARRNNCWAAPEDAQAEHPSSRSLRDSASTSHPGLPPDLSHVSHRALRHESHSLASLDGVLREMKAMIRNAPEDNVREETKTQERPTPMSRQGSTSRLASGGAKLSSRPSTSRLSLRGQRVPAVGRSSDATEDRSLSARRTSARLTVPTTRSMGRQRSQDELDFAVCEPGFAKRGATPPRDRGSAAPGRSDPTPPWERESRKPLESLEAGNAEPELGPAMPWARGGSVRNLQDGDQDWKTLQSSWNNAIANNTSSKASHGSGGQSQRPLSRGGLSAKRSSASENHMSNANMSGLGFIF